MSGNNEDDKAEANKAFPLDLASKLTVKPVEVQQKGTPLVMTAQPLRGMRVLAQSTVTGATSGTSPGSNISIVPQAVIKQGILNTNTAQSQTAGITVARPTHITLTTSVVGSQSSGTTYHVPRGPAVVANLATPRSAVASPIRASGLTTTPPGTTFVRQVAPARTPSPAGTALPTAWLSTGAMQVQTSNIKPTVGQPAVLSPTIARVPVSATPVRAQQVVARGQAVTQGARPTVMHTGIPGTQIHSFKPATGIQSVTIAQVLPRTQTLVYSAGNNQHFTASPRLALTGAITNQRPVTVARPNQVMAARLTVPVTISQGSTRFTTVTPGPGTIYTIGARISAVSAPAQTTVVGTNVRAAAPNNQPARLSVSSSGTLLTTTQARFTVANPTVQPGSAVVIGTQAGRVTDNVVSLHPVVVANPSQTPRSIQGQGPKVITQQGQGPSIQLAQVPTVAKIPAQQQPTVLPVAVTVAASQNTRTINVTPAAIVSQRPIVAAVSTSQAIPIAKVFSQNQRTTMETSEQTSTSVHGTPTNVFIHATPVVRRTSPGPTTSNVTDSQRVTTVVTTSVTTYSIASGTTYYYDTSSGNTVAGGNWVARPFTPSTGSFTGIPQTTPVQIRSTALPTQVHGIMSGQPIQFSPVMVVEQKRGNQQFLENPSVVQQTQEHINPLPSIGKVTSSPRPSILRKRDNEGSPLKAAKNLAPVLANLSSAPVSPPSRPESRGNNGGNSSGGSTTISATSSPGLDETGDNSQPLPSVNMPGSSTPRNIKMEPEDDRPPMEMSPRKKPRKQQLTGNDLHEPKFNLEDIQFLSDNKIKKEPEEIITPVRENPPEITGDITVKKPANASLLNSYRQNWKSTHNHYLRYTDVKPKDERRPTVIDLANQSQVTQKINGWKIHHLSTQMEDLSDLETQVYDKLSSLLKIMETKEGSGYAKEFNRINELIKGNMQRSKIINDGMVDAKCQVMKIFDHKDHVADIINRCASKRNFKKREKF